MPSYFRQVPNLEYISRTAENKAISDYIPVKNLFKRGKLRQDIFGNLTFFTKYSIIGDDRPDNVAFDYYNDPTLDWIVLLSNNIVNIQSEWPTPQAVFDRVMLDKYKTYDELYNGIHHYETLEIKNSKDEVMLPAGEILPNTWRPSGNFIEINNSKISQIFSGDGVTASTTVSVTLQLGIKGIEIGSEVIVSNISENEYNGRFVVTSVNIPFNDNIVRSFTYELSSTPNIASPVLSTDNDEEVLFKVGTGGNSYYFEYYDNGLEQMVLTTTSKFLKTVTNFEYESNIENEKRNIFLLKPEYLNIVFNDLEDIMPYKKGSTQYVNTTLKRGENIRLFE